MKKLEVIDVKHTYKDGERKNEVLKGINAEFKPGVFYAIVGESGSGKTTLLSLLAGLDSVQEGKIMVDGKSIEEITKEKYRLKCSNIIFQSYNLIPYMTGRENVDVAIDIQYKHMDRLAKRKMAYEVLEQVGIAQDMADRLVMSLSGGEQQRIAIARSIIGDVPIICADEPTGNLDEETEAKIIQIFKELARQGKCVIVVTHSKNVANMADEKYVIKKGIMKLSQK